MKKTIFKRLGILLLFTSFLVPMTRAQQTNDHMLWKIQKNGELQGYLLGSVHVMKPSVYPLDDVYQQVYKKADVLVFEANIDSMMAHALPLVQKLAVYPAGKTLKGALSTKTYHLLKATLDSLNLPAARFSRFEPWYIAMTLTSLQMIQAGYTGKAGIDRHFFAMAKKDGKRIIGLETAKFQLNIFDDLSPRLQEKYLKHILKQSGQAVEAIDEIVTAWKHGNAQKIEDLMQGKMQENFPKLYEKILVQRNKNWIPQITKLLATDGVPLVIVGAAHMVGSTGLVSLLAQQGYEVAQL